MGKGVASTSVRTPSNWPSELQYIQSQRYAPSIPVHILSFLRGSISNKPSPSPSSSKHLTSSSPSSSISIRSITDPAHPAFGQRGLFASKKIPPKTHIVDYVGEVHVDEREGSDYDLGLWKSSDGLINVGIDASKMGNEARFVNDYRGIKPKPNALFKDLRRGEDGKGELGMSIWSGSEGVKKGEEILVSYGKGWWRARTAEEDGDRVEDGDEAPPEVVEAERIL